MSAFFWLTLFSVSLSTFIVLSRVNSFSSLLIFNYLLVVVLFGSVWYTLHDQKKDPPEIKLTVFEQSLTLHGRIHESRITQSGNHQLEIKVDSVEVKGAGGWIISFITIARVFDTAGKSTFDAGDYIILEGSLMEASKPRNPNEFDYQKFLKNRNIYTITNIDKIISINPGVSKLNWLYWRVKVRNILSQIYSPDNAGLAKALILGDRDHLEYEQRTAFSRVGLAHFMAVSGMHVGFILLPIWLAIPYIWTLRFGKILCLSFVALILVLYCGLTGFSTSVVRASVMAILFIYSKVYQKPRQTLNILGTAALIILLFNPLEFFEIGFQLSFTAVLIIVLVLPVSNYLLYLIIRKGKFIKAIIQFVSISLFVQLGLYPILLHYFNELSIIGPLSNILAVLFIQFMFLLSILCIVIEALIPGLGVIINTPSDWLASSLIYYAGHVSTWEWTWFIGSVTSPFVFLIWLALFVTIASIYTPTIRWKMLMILILCGCLYQGHQLYKKSVTVLTITMFDVGQGDAVLLQTPEGKNILFDTGIQSFYHNSANRVILPELRARGIHHLDAVILSHPHSDHIGGMSMLIRNMSIKAIYESYHEYESAIYRKYHTDALQEGVPIFKVGQGDILNLASSMKFFILGPHPQLSGQSTNTQSMVVKVVFGETAVLLTGDADIQSEKMMIYQYSDFLKSDLLKVGHHASRTSSGGMFLAKVQPTIAAVSLSRQNQFNHPHPEATLRLKKSVPHILYTSINGALVFTSDGKTLLNINWRD
ncbi:MAG: DNA internalization-related competence protein ComEC/Rec2 [Balneolales bacterium]